MKQGVGGPGPLPSAPIRMYPGARAMKVQGGHSVWDVVRQAMAVVPRLGSFIQRPQLQLYFDAGSTYLTRDVVDAGGAAGFFCHVMVRNDGHTAARNCRGRLLEVSVRNPDGSTTPAPGFVAPVFLKWAREPDFEPRDVSRNEPRPLDLCYALASSPDQLRFFAPPSPSGVLIFPPGVYTLRLRVTADNVKAAQGVFRVDFTRGWNQILVAEGDGR
jgi:hypothetical protein